MITNTKTRALLAKTAHR